MGELFATMASEQLDIVYAGADLWARSRKADGDPRTLDQLRVAALVQWAQSFLHHGDPTYCDRWCTPGSHGPTGTTTDDDSDGPPPPPSRPPTRHGRPAALGVIWDLESLLGLASRCGELSDSGAVLPPDAMRELVDGGARLRRMVIDDASGELLDLTPRTWTLPRTQPTDLDAPVILSVIVTKTLWDAIRGGNTDPTLLTAIERAPQAVRDLLAHEWTADTLDTTPAAYPPPRRVHRCPRPAPGQPHRRTHRRSRRRPRPHPGLRRRRTHNESQPRRTRPPLAPTQNPRRLDRRPKPYDYRLGP